MDVTKYLLLYVVPIYFSQVQLSSGQDRLPILSNYVTFFTRPSQPPVNTHSLGVDISDANAIQLHIRSCGGVTILLHPRPRSQGAPTAHLDDGVEIILGKKIPNYDMYVTYIKGCRYNRPECRSERDVPVNPLRCQELTPIWISWSQTEVFSGRGTLLDRRQLVKVSNRTSGPMEVLSVTAETNSYWVFPPNEAV